MATTYEPIATTTLGSGASSITLSSIPGTYTDLKFILKGSVTSGGGPSVTFNSDTASNYSRSYMVGFNGIVSAATTNNTQSFNLGYFDTANPAMMVLEVLSYSGSSSKTVLGSVYSRQTSNPRHQHNVAMWRSSSAITSATFSASFAAGTIVTVYGIKAA